MWQRFQNIFSSISSYADLSPDRQIQGQVRQWLGDRPHLSLEEWFTRFWEPQGINRPLAEFVYHQMQAQSGLDFTRVQPSDRLLEDLHLPLICWFDWETSLCDHFVRQFGVEVFDGFDIARLHTLQDFVLFFQQQLDARH
jgi:hypothetical protein